MSILSRLFPSVAPLVWALTSASPALAEVRALLIGVSDYHHLDVDLLGPRNDVRLMAGALTARGADPAAIRVLTTPGTTLAEGLAPAGDPTRAAILGALTALATEAQPGDTVVFYYSGHGSLAPDSSGDEPDGFDQILLPADVTGWNGAKGLVENAILDDELQVHLQAILDRGAELVGIIDACHSATGFRDLDGAGVARYVAPALLGLPEALAETAEESAAPAALRGTFTFLYSSQQDQRSFEYPMGDKSNPDNWFGDFTRNLARALTEVESLTWAQTLAAASDGLRQEQAKQTPDGEGTGLNGAVFGGALKAETLPSGRMRVEGGKLMQGLLAGLNEGAELEIFDAAAGGVSMGRARLTALRPAEADLSADFDLPQTAYAELYAPGLPQPLRLAVSAPIDGGDYASAQSILAQIRTEDLAEGVAWDAADYDLKLVMIDGALVLVGRDGVIDPDGPGSAPRIGAEAGPDLILGFIDRAVRLHRLNQALALAQGAKRSFGIAGVGLSVSAELLPAEAVSSEGQPTEGHAIERQPIDAHAAEAAPLSLGCSDATGAARALKDGDAVRHCDQIWLTVSNSSRTAQDVTVLYLDRDMRILPIWPEQGLSNRLGFGASVEIGLRIETGAVPVGTEEIVIISVPARDGAPRTVLTGLAEPETARALTTSEPAAAWLAAAMETDGQSRSFRPGAKPDPIKVTRLRVRLADG